MASKTRKANQDLDLGLDRIRKDFEVYGYMDSGDKRKRMASIIIRTSISLHLAAYILSF